MLSAQWDEFIHKHEVTDRDFKVGILPARASHDEHRTQPMAKERARSEIAHAIRYSYRKYE